MAENQEPALFIHTDKSDYSPLIKFTFTLITQNGIKQILLSNYKPITQKCRQRHMNHKEMTQYSTITSKEK